MTADTPEHGWPPRRAAGIDGSHLRQVVPAVDSEEDYGYAPTQSESDRNKPPELEVADPALIEADILPRVYIVPKYIQRGVVTQIVGPGGVGKSQLFITWAVALALGEPVGDFVPPRPMRVINLDVEDTISEQQKHVAATLRLFQRDPAELHGQLKLVCPTKAGRMLRLNHDTKHVYHTPALDELINLIETGKPDILFLNPLSELHDAEENDNSSIRHIISELRVIAVAYDLAVVIAHHVSKGPARPGDADSGRGASAVVGVVRKSYTLFGMTKEEAALHGIHRPEFYFRLDGAKANNDERNPVKWFERKIFELDNGDIVAAAWPWQPIRAVLDPVVIEKLMEVIGCGKIGKPWSARLGKYERSIAFAMSELGIKDHNTQEQLLEAVFKLGVTEQGWRRANRSLSEGLRHPDGGPAVDWAN